MVHCAAGAGYCAAADAVLPVEDYCVVVVAVVLFVEDYCVVVVAVALFVEDYCVVVVAVALFLEGYFVVVVAVALFAENYCVADVVRGVPDYFAPADEPVPVCLSWVALLMNDP